MSRWIFFLLFAWLLVLSPTAVAGEKALLEAAESGADLRWRVGGRVACQETFTDNGAVLNAGEGFFLEVVAIPRWLWLRLDGLSLIHFDGLQYQLGLALLLPLADHPVAQPFIGLGPRLDINWRHDAWSRGYGGLLTLGCQLWLAKRIGLTTGMDTDLLHQDGVGLRLALRPYLGLAARF